jgi:hypothetical protein
MATIVSTRILRLQAITPRTQDVSLPADVVIPPETEIAGTPASDIVDDVAQALADAAAATASQIGVGQTWQDVKDSRAAGTPYTNSTGKPIFVSVTMVNLTTSLGGFAIVVDGVVFGYTDMPGYQGGIWSYGNMSLIIPNGSTYQINSTNGTFYSWAELR